MWDIARLGHCFDKKSSHSSGCSANLSEARSELIEPGHAPAASAATLLPGVGRSFCAHALGVTRKGAEHLLRLAYPVSSYFDDQLYALAGGFGESAQRVALEHAGVQSADELHAFHSSESLFGQRSKDGSLPTLIHLRREPE